MKRHWRITLTLLGLIVVGCGDATEVPEHTKGTFGKEQAYSTKSQDLGPHPQTLRQRRMRTATPERQQLKYPERSSIEPRHERGRIIRLGGGETVEDQLPTSVKRQRNRISVQGSQGNRPR